MNSLSKESVSWHEIGPEADGQRIDNYLVRRLKGVPKSHVYRMLRSGEVRVNSGRVGPDHRLKSGDRLRIPPVRVAVRADVPRPARGPAIAVLFEDDALLAVNKPAGLAVHGGSGIAFGVIEQLRHERPDARFLELVHRLDRDTSGALVIAKKRSALVALHEQLRAGTARKFYLALVCGRWPKGTRKVDLPLHKYTTASGERRVAVATAGKAAATVFRLQWHRADLSLVEAELLTGRTHQIRVHLAHSGHAIVGDDKYGDHAMNRALAERGFKRMFLHAERLIVKHPGSGNRLEVVAPLPADFSQPIEQLEHAGVAPV